MYGAPITTEQLNPLLLLQCVQVGGNDTGTTVSYKRGRRVGRLLISSIRNLYSGPRIFQKKADFSLFLHVTALPWIFFS